MSRVHSPRFVHGEGLLFVSSRSDERKYLPLMIDSGCACSRRRREREKKETARCVFFERERARQTAYDRLSKKQVVFVIVAGCVRVERAERSRIFSDDDDDGDNKADSSLTCFQIQLFSLELIFCTFSMAAGNVLFKSTPKQMSDSWIVIDDQDESDFVVVDGEGDNHRQSPVPLIPSPKVSPQSKRPLGQSNNNNNNNINNKPSKMSQGVANNKQQNKKRKWKVLYSLPSTGVKGNVDDSNLDSYVMDQHAQLLDKRDMFSYQQSIVKVK